MHGGGTGHNRDEIVRQVEEDEESVYDFAWYVPIGDAVGKLARWGGGAEVLYLTSRTADEEVESIRQVLKRYGFPDGRLLFRHPGDEYWTIAERLAPGILVEDDCESIGGADEMTITDVRPAVRKKIKSIALKEFGGIDHLPGSAVSLAAC